MEHFHFLRRFSFSKTILLLLQYFLIVGSSLVCQGESSKRETGRSSSWSFQGVGFQRAGEIEIPRPLVALSPISVDTEIGPPEAACNRAKKRIYDTFQVEEVPQSLIRLALRASHLISGLRAAFGGWPPKRACGRSPKGRSGPPGQVGCTWKFLFCNSPVFCYVFCFAYLLLLYICPLIMAASHRHGTSRCLNC